MIERHSQWLPRTLYAWALGALVTLAVMLTHQSDIPILAGRYSTAIVLIMIGLLLIALMGGIGGWWFGRNQGQLGKLYAALSRWQRWRGFQVAVLGIAAGIIFILWVFLLDSPLPSYAALRVFLVLTIVIGATALIGYAYSRWGYLLWIGAAVMVGIALMTLASYPALLKTDEAVNFSMARNVLETGHRGPLIYQYSHPADYFGGVWTWVMAIWLQIVGISLTTGRLYTLLVLLLSLTFIYLGAARLYDKPTARYAVVIGAYVCISLNHILYHVHATFWLAASVFFYSLGKTKARDWWAYLAAGFTAGMTVDSTPIAYCFGLGLALVVAWEVFPIRRETAKRGLFHLFLLGLGGGLALLVYGVTHSGETYVNNQTSSSMFSSYLGHTLEQLRTGGWLEMGRIYFGTFLATHPILFGLSLIGFITALIKRETGDGLLVVLYVVWTLVIVFTYYYFPAFYLVVTVPITVMLAARGVAAGLPLLLGNAVHLQTGMMILLVVWLAASVTRDLRNLPSQSLADVVETGQQIGKILPPDARIVAAEPYYFGLLDHLDFVGGAIENFMTSFRGMTPEAAWDFIRPDAIVFSENWAYEPAQTPALNAYMRRESFQRLHCYETLNYGRVELWVKTIPAGFTVDAGCS